MRAAKFIQKLASDDRGSIAIIAAFTMPVMVGGMALGAEAGSWYMKQRKLQHAADMAAYAAAIRLMQGDTSATATTAGQRVGKCTWDNDPNCQTTSTVTINITTPYGGNSKRVEAQVSETVPRYLSAILASGSVSLSARAVAQYTLESSSKACVLALKKDADVGIKVSGNTSVSFNGCDVVSNSGSESSFSMQSGAAVITTDCIRLSGEASTNANADINLKCDKIAEYRPAIQDPYKDVPEPSIIGSCQSSNIGNPKSNVTLTPADNHPSGLKSMNFCKGMDIKGTVVLKPGIYLIGDGGLTINAQANVSVFNDGTGAGVMFFMYGQSNVKMNGGANINLKPITLAQHPIANGRTYTYAGLLFFASRTNTAQQQINGGSTSTMTGAVYAPAAEVKFSGNSSTGSSSCMQLVAATIEFTGNSGVSADCSSIGGTAIYSNPSAALIE